MIQEKIEYWHPQHLAGMELSRAHFQQFEFAKHVHLDYHIGVVTEGSQQYNHKGDTYRLGKGFISTLNPDETHNGHSSSAGGYRVQVMSLPVSYVSQIARELGREECFFSAPLHRDPVLHLAFLRLHRMLTTSITAHTRLQVETSLMAFITEILSRYTLPRQRSRDTGKILSVGKFNEIKAQFHDQLHHSFQLDELAGSIGLSKFQFLRQFKSATGMTPHAYLKRVRLEYAKKSLASGEPVVDTAHQLGFFDQSHLNKAFKSAYLVTPAHFQRRVI